MLESSYSLLPFSSESDPLSVCVLGVEDESLKELGRLLSTLDVKIAHQMQTTVRKIHPGTYFGAGKLEELKKLSDDENVKAVVIDLELSPMQLKNVEEFLKKPTVDRSGVIIDIFSRHARTKESKTQVELARLRYLLPRLAHYWTHFERQRGGIGNKGMGETQIEVDRRLVKKRLSLLEDRLEEIAKEKQLHRESRKDVLKVALVGYTNAGKSTLLNALTSSEVLAQDKLFSTLDSCVRLLSPDSHPPIVAIDTVGFIRNIPTTLIASFRSTLAELQEADLLVHVVDASSLNAKEEIETTLTTLADLGVGDKPKMTVLNKMDRITDPLALNQARVLAPGATRLSALNREEVLKFRAQVFEFFAQSLSTVEVLIPYSEGRLEALIHEHSQIEKKTFHEKGTFYRIKIEELWANKLSLERFKV